MQTSGHIIAQIPQLVQFSGFTTTTEWIPRMLRSSDIFNTPLGQNWTQYPQPLHRSLFIFNLETISNSGILTLSFSKTF